MFSLLVHVCARQPVPAGYVGRSWTCLPAAFRSHFAPSIGPPAAGSRLGVVGAMSAANESGNFAQAIGWTVMAAVVLVRPRGLLGRLEVERV